MKTMIPATWACLFREPCPRGGTIGRAASGLLLLAFLLAFGPYAVCAEKTDVIVLRNGDRVTGEIMSLGNGLLTYKTNDMGTLTIEWEKVARISSRSPFILEGSDGQRHTGAIQEASEPGRLVVLTDDGPVTLDTSHVVGIVRFGKRLGQRFQGYLDLGFSLQKAQKNIQVNLASNLSYISKKWEARTDASTYYAKQEDIDSTMKNLLSLNFKRVFQSLWSAAIFTQLESNTELNLALRLLAGAGVGRHFIRNNRQNLSAVAALDVTRESYLDETDPKTSLEGVLGVNYQAFRYVSPDLSITAGAFAYPSLTEKGRIRFNFQTSIRYELFKRFYVSIGFLDSYDSKPGGEATAKNDYSVTFSISWSLN